MKQQQRKLAYPNTRGYYVTTHAGHTAHVQAEYPPSDATQAALEALIDAAYQAIENGTITSDRENTNDGK